MRDFAGEPQAKDTTAADQDDLPTPATFIAGGIAALFRTKFIDRLAFMTGMGLYVLTCVFLVYAVWALTT